MNQVLSTMPIKLQPAPSDLPGVAHATGAGAHVEAPATAGQPAPCITPLPQGDRQCWHQVATGIGRVTPQHEQVRSFATRQVLDMFHVMADRWKRTWTR